MKIVPVTGYDTLAWVDVYDPSTIYVDAIRWPELTEGERQFVIAHEQAHFRGIESESDADAYARKAVEAMGYKASDLAGLSTHFNFDSPEDFARAQNLSPMSQVNSDWLESQLTGDSSSQPRATNTPTNTGGGGGFNWQQFADTLVNVVPDVIASLPGGQGRAQNMPDRQPPPQAPRSGPDTTTLLLIGGGILVVVAIFFLTKSK